MRHLFLIWVLSFGLTSAAQDSIACNKLITKGIEGMMSGAYPSAIENLTKSYELARANKWPRQHFLAANNLGLTHYKMMDYGKALTYFLEAYELAKLQKDPSLEMSVLNNIAIVYIKEEKNDQAEKYFLKSLTIAQEHSIDNRIGYYATNLANLNLEMKRIDEAERYIAIALPKLKGEPRVLLSAQIVRNALLFERKRTGEVIQNSLNLLSQAVKGNFHDEEIEIRLLLANSYLQQSWPEKSLSQLENALKLNPNIENKIKLFDLRSAAALKLDKVELAMASKDSVIRLTQLLSDTKNRELVENAALKFELSESRHDLDSSKLQAANRQKIYLLSIGALLLGLIGLSVVFYKRNQIAHQKKIIDEHAMTIKNLELDQEKSNSRALKHEVEAKNRMLSDKILFQSTRNELIGNIIESVSSEAIDNPNAVRDVIRNLKTHLREDAKWEDFTSHFENVNTEFLHNLKARHPQLNANDIRFLSFVYLNLNTKEIASFLNISPESCRKRKERLLKKLNLGPEVSLYAYLSQLY